MRPIPSPYLFNIAAAFSAMVAIAVVSFTTRDPLPASLIQAGSHIPVEIGVEHQEPMGLTFEISSLGGVSIVEIGTDAEERVGISVPSSWIRREVRGAPIAEVISSSSEFGFTRWELPGGSSVSFRVPETPREVILHNPSGVALKVVVTRVMLPEEIVERDVLLVQEGKKELW